MAAAAAQLCGAALHGCPVAHSCAPSKGSAALAHPPAQLRAGGQMSVLRAKRSSSGPLPYVRGVPSGGIPLREGLVKKEAGEKKSGMRINWALAAKSDASGEGQEQGLVGNLASVGIGLFWAGFVAYAFTLSPNQTPYQDTYFLQKLVGLNWGDGFQMNPVLVALFYIMGVWPQIYTQLLIPTGRSSKGFPPIWPFCAVSFGTGAFALLPYFALWQSEGPPPLPSAQERQNRGIKIWESKITSWLGLVGAVGLIVYAATSGSDAWTEFIQYFRESRFIHVMSLDFLILTSMAPFWVYNDMSVREWEGRDRWWIPMSAVPVIGPAAWLVLRPKLPE